MIGTWHGSCTHACTCTTSDQSQFQFARPASLPGVCAIGGRRSPLPLASAATPFDNEQMLPGSERGARSFVTCRATPVRVIDLRGQVYSNVRWNGAGACNSSGPNGSIFGIGYGANRPFAIIHHRHQGRFQRIAKGHPAHSKLSVPVAFKPSDGAIGSDQKAIGVYQNDDC